MDKPYKVVIPGVDGGGAQVFEADTPEEMQQQFQKAQENATAKIRELAQQKTALEQQVQQFGQPANGDGAGTPDASRQQFFNTLYEHPDDAIIGALERKMGMTWNDFTKDWQTVRGGAMMGIQNSVNAQFAQKHPELLQVGQDEDAHNADAISKIITENGWSYNLNNLEAAYAVAKTQGKLKLNDANQFAPEAHMTPVPSTVTRPTGQVNTSASEEEYLRTAPIPKVREYLEKKYGGQQG